MKKRTRKAANLYKEPSSDLSDLDLSSDDIQVSAAQAAKRSKPSKAKPVQTARLTTNPEESKGEPQSTGKTYGKC